MEKSGGKFDGQVSNFGQTLLTISVYPHPIHGYSSLPLAHAGAAGRPIEETLFILGWFQFGLGALTSSRGLPRLLEQGQEKPSPPVTRLLSST